MATSIFLKLDPIKGNSEVDGFKEQIDVLSWSWGATNTRTMGVGSAASAGSSDTMPLMLTKRVDKATPNLMNQCQSAKPIPEAVLSITKQIDEKATTYLEIKLTNVFVNSFSVSGDGEGSAEAHESFGLSFEACEYTFTGQNADGTAAASSPKTWNIHKNAPK